MEPSDAIAVRLDAVLLESNRPEALAEFYRRAFDLPAPRVASEAHLGMPLGNTYLGFDRVPADASTRRGSFSIWFRVASVERSFARLVGLGAEVVYGPTRDESPGEILAVVLDPDGNQVGLICPDSEAE